MGRIYNNWNINRNSNTERNKNMNSNPNPSADDVKDSSYLTKGDVEPPRLLTIADPSWKEEDVSMENKPTKMKYVIYFEEVEKGLVLNNTNTNRITRIAGDKFFNNWPGTKVVLYNDEDVEFGGKTVGGIRVRPPKTQQQEDDIPF